MEKGVVEVPDREKTIQGLEHCTQSFDCKGCPYYTDRIESEICTLRNGKDALALLKALEPRLLTLEEVLNADDFVWAEIYTPKKWSWCVVYAKISPLVGNDEIVLIEEDCGTGWTRNKAEYGKRGFLNGGWRCWSVRPTEEQRKAVKWDE